MQHSRLRVGRAAAAILLVVGLGAAGVSILAEELGLGANPGAGMFGWRHIALLVVGMSLAAAGAALLARRGWQPA